MKPARLPRMPRPRTLRREALRRLLRALRHGRGLRPLVSALAGVLPLVTAQPALAGSFPRGVVRAIQAPSPLAVPTPAADWLQQGQATHNHGQAQASGQMQVDQTSGRAIYRWSRFDIGARARLAINTPSGGSSLNLVAAGDPSRIFGSLTSNGEVFLVNPSGIWFGRGASVNVAGLFASTLQMDAADYEAGLANSLRSAAPTFSWQDVTADGAVLQTFDHPDNFVHVDTGATLTTPSGGRVFLLAREATNAGRIDTPGGQTVLAAGREVYLQSPSAEKLYASETNANVPATRGLLVEVGGGEAGEVASNLGEIVAQRGNVTLVGLAVNQAGRISATTSVQENGSVFLLARSGATALNDNSSVLKRAIVGGQLTLGAGSRIDITPEASSATSTDASGFTRSRLELSGQTITLQDGAAIRAPGGIANLRAADVPQYDLTVAVDPPPSPTARIVLGANTTIDVAGTTDAQASAARNFVRTELIGQSDLRDAPLQKLGPLYQKSGVVFDVREDVPILGLKAGDAANPYLQATARTASERLSSGGTISLQSTGLVAAHASSRLDVSGGRFTYTAATVPAASVLVSEDGSRYTLNDAPVDLAYRALEGYATPTVDRFGANAPAGANLQGRHDPGYVEGRAAGTLAVTAPVAHLDGQMSGATFAGSRQATGADPLAAAGTLRLGRTSATAQESTVMGSLALTAAPAATDAAFWADPLAAAVVDEAGQPIVSRISTEQIRAGGFGKLDVAAEGRIEQQAGADLLLPEQSSVSLRSRLGDIALNASTTSRGGSVSATASTGSVALADGQRIDVAGNFVNRWRDGAAARAAVKGGSIALRAGQALSLGRGTVLDASGGATLGANGSSVSGTAAGSIVLESNNASISDAPLAAMTLGGELRAFGWAAGQGGSLRVKAGEVVIEAGDAAPRTGGLNGATLTLGDGFFEQGGFAAYDIEGVRALTVQDGARITPRTAAWLGRAGLRNVASGTDMARVFATGPALDGRLSPVKLTLQSRGSSTIDRLEGEGALRVAAGAVIESDARSSISLVGGNSLIVEGDVRSAGGSVSLALAGRNSNSLQPFAGTLRVAGTAEIDVSGTRLITPDGDRYNQGQVLAGGTISMATTVGDALAASRTLIDIEDGASLRANGATGVLDVARPVGGSGPAMARDQLVASNGGSVTLNVREGGAYLGGALQARAGQGQLADGSVVRGEGGSLAIGIGGSSRDGSIIGAVPEVALVLQQAAPTRADIAPGTVTVSADRLAAGGFDNVALASQDRIVLQGDIDYRAAGTLSLDAPVLTARQAAQAAGAAQRVNLSAVNALRVGSSLRISASQPLPDSGPTAGSARLAFSGGLMELFGEQVVQGAQQIRFAGDTELRLRGVVLSGEGAAPEGQLRAAADVTFSAPQVVPNTATRYTVDLSGEDGTAEHTLRITGGDAASATPLSAAAVFTAKAADIVLDDGVVRAPFGQVALQATRSITVQGESLVSVSGNGLAVPYGGTVNGGSSWAYDGRQVEAPLAKSITLAAPGQTVSVVRGESGTPTLDLSGGGQLVGWEFVPGPGGSTDVFTGAAGAYAIVPTITGYAPHDAAIAGTQGGTTLGGALALGQQITLGEGGPLPAGTYALLPARYALLPGAFLVSPQGSTATALGRTQARPDGSYVVGATTGRVGSAANNAVGTAWRLTPSAVARRSSEVRTTDADTFFAQQAARQGTVAPRLARDAGALNIDALRLALESVNRFAVQDAVSAATAGRGGSLNISSERIHVGAAGAPLVDGALNLSVAQLNATGAYSLMLGGRRGASSDTGTEVQVTAREISVDTGAATALQAGDIVLAATEKVEVAAGSRLSARDQAGTAEQLAFSGDGALLRVSEDVDAASVRTGALGLTGDLSIGADVALTGGAVTVEATNNLALDRSARVTADTINVGARRIELAPAAGQGGLETGIQVGTANLAAQLAGARRVGLRGFDGISLAAGTQLGAERLAQITLDTSSLRAAAGASVRAGSITLANTTGYLPAEVRETGAGALTLQAHGGAGGDGHVRLTGQQAIDGVVQVAVTAAGSVVIGRDAQLATGGDLLLTATTLTGATGAAPTVVDAGQSTERSLPQIQAGGLLSLSRPAVGQPQVAAAPAGLGASVVLAADRIEQGGTIDLPTARLELRAEGSSGGTAVRFADGSQTLLPGVARTFDGQVVAAPAGQLIVKAAAGDVVAAAGSLIDVSAATAPASAGGGAGSVDISAPQGEVQLDGRLRAVSSAGQTGGSLSVDALRALNLAALGARLADERQGLQGASNFGALLKLRNRSGDQGVAAGTVLQAQQIALTSDAGALTVAGTLQAGGSDSVNAGGVRLQAGGDVTLQAGAQVTAHARGTGEAGGTVLIGTQAGRIDLQSGAVLAASGQGDARDGTLKLRAPRTGAGAGTDVAIEALAADVSGMGAVEVEGFKAYEATTINQGSGAAQGTVSGGASGTVATVAQAESFLSGSAAIVSRLTAGLTAEQRSKVSLRAGIEVRSQGDLTLANAWNLTRFDANGGIERAGGQPINLTLRAAGDLLLNASLSDGFKAGGATTATAARAITASGVIVGERGSDLRLAGGADLSSADLLATVQSAEAGDVKIGRNGRATLVRTTTGDIDIAAGRDVVLDSRQAVVYSTGVPLEVGGFAGYRAAADALRDGTLPQSPFLQGAGQVSLTAGRDVVGGSNGPTPYLTNWWWRSDNRSGQAFWYTRYDQFEQGVASFGGGDVRVSAGRDALQVQLASPESGLLTDEGFTRLRGGDVSLAAGRHVVGGLLVAGGDEATVTASRIDALPSFDELTPGDALQVLHGDTAVSLQAARGMVVGRVAEAGAVGAARQGNSTPNAIISGLASQATLSATVVAGNLDYRATRPAAIDNPNNSIADTYAASFVPQATRLVALQGDLQVGHLVIDPASSPKLSLLAQGDVTLLGGLRLFGGDARRAAVSYGVAELEPTIFFGDPARPALSRGAVEPLRIMARQGAIRLDGAPIQATVPARVIAGGDILASSTLEMQHQSATDLSLVQAGGDLAYVGSNGAASLIRLHGPGDLVVMAAGDIDLGEGSGILTLGNLENTLLPRGSATAHVLAGVDPARGDYTEAAQRSFAVLAGGLAALPDELAAQIEAARGLGVTPAADDAALLARARGLAGDAAYEQALLRAMQRETKDLALTTAQAQAAFEALPEVQRAVMARQVAGDLLAATWLATIPAAEQPARVLALAVQQTGGAARLASLRRFVSARGGDPGDDAAVLARFAQLPVEQQIVALTPVLEQVVIDAGKAAAQAQGAAKTRAYAPAYQALAAVFPQTAPTADLRMGASQIAARQGAPLHILAPNGGVNVGELTANSNKSASQLGIVSLGGSAQQPAPINLLVRDDVAVNQSRVFSVDLGDVLMWSSSGNLDAGRGAKTVTGAPAPTYYLDGQGKVQVDLSSAFSGSGIAVLNADSTLYLFAPRGEINTGDAGIQSAGAAFIDAVRVVGPSLQVAGPAVGLPAPPAVANAAASLGNLGQSATAAGQAAPSSGEQGDEAPRRNLSLDFVAFGAGEIPMDAPAAGPAGGGAADGNGPAAGSPAPANPPTPAAAVAPPRAASEPDDERRRRRP